MKNAQARTGSTKRRCSMRHQRESLVDLEQDPGESINLATDSKHREILLAHRELPAQFAKQNNDPAAAKFLAADVKPQPFTAQVAAPKKPKK